MEMVLFQRIKYVALFIFLCFNIWDCLTSLSSKSHINGFRLLFEQLEVTIRPAIPDLNKYEVKDIVIVHPFFFSVANNSQKLSVSVLVQVYT